MAEGLGQMMIPLMLAAIFFYYGIKIITTGDVSLILRKEQTRGIKDLKQYSQKCGMLVIALGAASLGMAVLSLIDVRIAVGEIIAAILVIGILWKIVDDKYRG